MAKKEYILSEEWCPTTHDEKTLVESLQKDYGPPEFKYVFHPPKEHEEDILVLYGTVMPNIHVFLSIDNPREHLPFKKLQQKTTLKHFEIQEESLDTFAIDPLEVIKNIKNHSTPS